VAEEYAARMFHELAAKPRDRELLDRFLASLPGPGPVCDLGCGPGQVARYLADRGRPDVLGIDLSPEMVRVARARSPGLRFRQGDMLALDLPDGSLQGIAAFYSIIHIAPERQEACFRELKRVLAPGGLLLVSFHLGDETVHLDQWWGKPVSVDFHFLRPSGVAERLRAAGFRVEETIEREPYAPEVEHQSRRAYVFARVPR
jgi:SAM-dependent methyltransferase